MNSRLLSSKYFANKCTKVRRVTLQTNTVIKCQRTRRNNAGMYYKYYMFDKSMLIYQRIKLKFSQLLKQEVTAPLLNARQSV